MSIDDDNNNDEAMETALNKLRALESLHGMDIGLDHDEQQQQQQQHVTATTATTSDNQTSKLVEAATAAAASDTIDHHQQSSRSPSLSPPGSNETSTSSLDTNRTTATTSTTDQKENQPTVVATSTMGGKRIPATVSDIRRCRLPLRAFKLTEENANVNNTTTKEKVLSVVKKRQSISEIHWAQGSKLPVFKAQPPSILEDIKEKKIKRVKSVRLPKEQAKETGNNKPVRKPLMRANTMPASQSSNLLLKKQQQQQQQKPASVPKKSQNNNKPTSPVSSSKSIARPKVMFSPPASSAKEQRPKKKVSIYRRKCLPGESRTARLMMGISTTGRVRSPRENMSTSPNENMPPAPSSNSRSFLRDSIKKRPVSFADKQPDAKKIHPEATQTTPLPVATKSKRFPFGKKPSSSSANKGPQQPTKSTAATSSFKGIKAVRVH